MNQPTKFCRKCLYTKPITDYSICSGCKDGLQSMCKSCWKLSSKGLPISQNPDAADNTNDYNNKIELINGELTVVGKLSPEEEDQLRRDWGIHPYNKSFSMERVKEIWFGKKENWSNIAKNSKGNRGSKKGHRGSGRIQKILAEEQLINDINNE